MDITIRTNLLTVHGITNETDDDQHDEIGSDWSLRLSEVNNSENYLEKLRNT